MTEAQQEAKRIVEKFKRKITRGTYFSKGTKTMQVNQCAVMAVEMIIEELEFNNAGNAMEYKRVIFYKVVKAEIEKL